MTPTFKFFAKMCNPIWLLPGKCGQLSRGQVSSFSKIAEKRSLIDQQIGAEIAVILKSLRSRFSQNFDLGQKLRYVGDLSGE